MATHSISGFGARSALFVLAQSMFGFFLFSGCASGDGTPAPTRIAEEGLTITVADNNHVVGRFAEHGVGLTFDSSKDAAGAHLKFENLSGEPLFELNDDPSKKQQTIRFLGGRLSQTISYRLMAAPAPDTKPSPSDLDSQGEFEAASTFGRSAEFALLPDLSRALGQAGFDGGSHPGALPLHLAAMSAQNAIAQGMTGGSQPGAPATQASTPAPPGVHVTGLAPGSGCSPIKCWNGQTVCFGSNACPPNPNAPPPPPPPLVCPQANGMDLRSDPCNNGCFGMCGSGCSDCWDSVCGNCSYNESCADHDSWCRSCSWSAPWNCGLCYSPAATWAYSCRL